MNRFFYNFRWYKIINQLNNHSDIGRVIVKKKIYFVHSPEMRNAYHQTQERSKISCVRGPSRTYIRWMETLYGSVSAGPFMQGPVLIILFSPLASTLVFSPPRAVHKFFCYRHLFFLAWLRKITAMISGFLGLTKWALSDYREISLNFIGIIWLLLENWQALRFPKAAHHKRNKRYEILWYCRRNKKRMLRYALNDRIKCN